MISDTLVSGVTMQGATPGSLSFAFKLTAAGDSPFKTPVVRVDGVLTDFQFKPFPDSGIYPVNTYWIAEKNDTIPKSGSVFEITFEDDGGDKEIQIRYMRNGRLKKS